MNALHLFLPDTDATLALGRVLAPLLQAEGAPRVVLLYGDLGSGKTTFVRGLVAALPQGTEAEVASPSFTIMNLYATTPPVAHADLFRCPPGLGMPEDLEDILDADFPKGMRGETLAFIEWPEHLPAACIPVKRLDILLEACQNSRRFSVLAHGEAARRVCALLAERVRAEHPYWCCAE